MTMQSILADPKLFRCAINVAGVGDWETWTTGGLILGRLGETPVTDPGLYDRSAPVRHLEKLQTPLLILQGTKDANVPFWETLKVIDSLEKLGKPFDMAIYPGEIHFFRRAYVLRDAWRRSEAFFDMYLKSTDKPTTAGRPTELSSHPPAPPLAALPSPGLPGDLAGRPRNPAGFAHPEAVQP